MEPHARYQMLEKIASGSFATVYRGRDLELGRDVAIKQIHEHFLESPQQLERFWTEAQLLASLQHPNIVTIYDLVRDRGWLIMELMQGNLGKVAGRAQMPLASLRTSLAHCLRALKFLHSHGIVHGDVKPANMMIDRRKRVKLGDFGLARRVSNEEGSLLKGTTKYMAPEVVSDEFGEVGPASDLYSLGFAAYELLCGDRFETLFPGLGAFGRDRQIAWMMWHAAPDRRLPEIKRVLEGVPDDLARTIQKLIAKPQSERYRSADEALSDLNIDLKLVKGGEDAEDQGPAATASAPDRNKRWIAIGAAAGSFLFSLLVLFWPAGGSGPSPTESGARPVVGVVRDVQLGVNRMEIEDQDGLPTEIGLGESPRILLDGPKDERKYILPRDLRKGDRVEVRVDEGKGKRAVQIVALRPKQSRGPIKKLNAADGELVLSIEDLNTPDVLPLQVTPSTKVLLNNRSVSLEDLHPGDVAEIAHLFNSQSGLGRVAIRIAALRSMLSTGFLADLDADKHQLAIEQRATGQVSKSTFAVAENCIVRLNGQNEIDGRPVSLSDLKRGDRVVVTHDVQVTEIQATRRDHAAGVVMDVAENSSGLTVQTNAGQKMVFRVEPACEVLVGHEEARLDEVRKYDHIDITYDLNAEGQLVARTLDVVRPTKHDRLVILVAEQNYSDRRLTRLPYSVADARLLKEALIKRYCVSPERVLLVTDAPRADVKRLVAEWIKKTSNLTQLIVYFAGNAYMDDKGTVYLAVQDTDDQRLEATGVRLDWLTEEMEACPAKEKLLLLDASHAGNGADLAREPSSAEMLETVRGKPSPGMLKTTVAVGSCAKGEAGQDWTANGHGLFAYYLAQAFLGKADLDRDLTITPRELYDFLRRTMTRATVEGQPTQTPVLISPQ